MIFQLSCTRFEGVVVVVPVLYIYLKLKTVLSIKYYLPFLGSWAVGGGYGSGIFFCDSAEGTLVLIMVVLVLVHVLLLMAV